MRTLADKYRAKASECAELAAKTRDLQSKRVLEQTAEQWNALADGIESRLGSVRVIDRAGSVAPPTSR